MATLDRLRVWCVSDGRAGIERQTMALAEALAESGPVDTQIVRLTPGAPQVWLPPGLWPAPLAALPADQRRTLAPPWPDVWIANGRRSIPYSLWVRRQASPPYVVQVQDPRMNPTLFDLVVPPAHDRLIGANVMTLTGAPVWFGQDRIDAAIAMAPRRTAWAPALVLVIVGGTSKRHALTPERTGTLINDLKALTDQGHALAITTSRRTPDHARAGLRAFAGQTASRFFDNEADDGPNPYLSWLATADASIVTEDSTNMLTDAAFFGLPIHLYQLDGGDARFDRLHQGFINHGAARWFAGRIEQWSYTDLRLQTLEVAHRIRMDLKTKQA
jgi:uncharacterized protein